MKEQEEDIVDTLDTPIGKEILVMLLTKTGSEIGQTIENYSLLEFIEARCELYHESLTEGYQSTAFLEGPIGHTGVIEKARSLAFEGLD